MIYVDDYEGRFGRMIMCHMMSDTSLKELHEFAERLGLKRSWFQDKGSAPHYDVCKSKRVVALELGAIHLPIRGGPQTRAEWKRVYNAAKALRRSSEN